LSTKSTKKEVTLPFGSIVWPSFTGAALLAALDEDHITIKGRQVADLLHMRWERHYL
jgi:hypothetical protein